MKIKITADSTCDLSEELLQQYDIDMIPLTINRGEEALLDGVEITAPDVFAYYDKTGNLCKTAAVNRISYEEIFAKYLENYDAVIHINISTEFSSCYHNACAAAQELQNVYVVDSRNLSTGIGHLALTARDLAEKGWEPAKICNYLQEMTARVEVSFVLDTLEYLRRGGRCSALAALGANLLKLRPCIEVVDGKMEPHKKYRGQMERCLLQYVDDKLSGRTDIEPERIFITHSGCTPELVEAVRKQVKKNYTFAHIYETQAGCTISSHCGPNCLGILYVRKA